MLNSHPALAVPDESHFIPPLLRRRQLYELGGNGFDVDRFLADLLPNRWFCQWGIPPGQVASALHEAAVESCADAIRTIFALYAHRQGKSRYGDKTTYARSVPLLAESFPEARFLHVIRDGRDVALALVDVEWGPASVVGAALLWRRHIESARAAGLKLGGQRYKEVRYEQLIDDPRRVLESVCEFLSLDFRPEMLTYFTHADSLMANSFYSRDHSSISLPPTPGLRDWRTQMTRTEVSAFDGLAGTLLKDLDYERPPVERAKSGPAVESPSPGPLGACLEEAIGHINMLERRVGRLQRRHSKERVRRQRAEQRLRKAQSRREKAEAESHGAGSPARRRTRYRVLSAVAKLSRVGR